MAASDTPDASLRRRNDDIAGFIEGKPHDVEAASDI
jgi:hypothetical protein